MSDSDKDVFLKKDLNEYVKECERNFDQHKFEYAETGLKIGHTIINEFLNKRISATPQGQKVSANNEDMFHHAKRIRQDQCNSLSFSEEG